VFEVYDFALIIGHSIEKLFLDVPRTGVLDIKLDKLSFSFPISRSKNSLTEPVPESEPIENMLVVSPFESLNPSSKMISTAFVEEEDDFGDMIELPKTDPYSRPPIELKSLPLGLRYVFSAW
jgi:hypothetical protein